MFKISWLILLLMAGCTSQKAFVYPKPQTQEGCMQLFTDVLKIQKKRNKAADEMGVYTERLEAGKTSVRKYRKQYHAWLSKENRMRDMVTHIYDVGYDAGCFDEEKQWTK